MKTALYLGCIVSLLACASTPAPPALTSADATPQNCAGVGGPTDPEHNEQRLGEEPTVAKGAKKATCN